MKKIHISRIPQISGVKVDTRGQKYFVYPDGQMQRISQNETPLPRIRMSKKKRLKLRREYTEIKNLKQEELATKILEAPVVNPVSVSKSTLAEESKMGTVNA
jgi:hypothetical protein